MKRLLAMLPLIVLAAALAARAAAPPAEGTYQDKKRGVTLHYPAAWTTHADADYDLRLVPAAGGAPRTITFDAPDIPSIPLFGIPMGMVESHYISDVQSKHAGAKVDSASDFKLQGANKARLVLLSWKREASPHQCAALLIVHGNDVFILCADADANDWAATRADFDRIAASITWSAGK